MDAVFQIIVAKTFLLLHQERRLFFAQFGEFKRKLFFYLHSLRINLASLLLLFLVKINFEFIITYTSSVADFRDLKKRILLFLLKLKLIDKILIRIRIFLNKFCLNIGEFHSKIFISNNIYLTKNIYSCDT